MSLPVQVPLQSVIAVAGQTVFPFNFRCDDGTTIRVYLNDVLQGGATVAPNADQTAAPGGTVTLVAGAVLNDVVSIERVTPPAQTLALTPYGAFGAVAIVAVLDKIIELAQELLAALTRTLRASRANAAKMASLDLPPPVVGQLLGWVDAGGGLIKLGNTQVTIVSPQNVRVRGQLLTDSGDHINFTSPNVPIVGTVALYRNGQRVFSPDDFTQVGAAWTLTIPVNPALGEKINADYDHA